MKANTTTDRKNVFFENIFIIVCSVLLFSLILFSSLNHTIFNTAFYEKEFQKTRVYDQFGKDTVDTQTKILLDYLDDKNKSINSKFFNEKEKQHMIDVKKLIVLSKIIIYSLLVLLSSIFSFVVWKKKKDEVIKFISKTFILTSIMAFVLFTAAYFLQDQFSQIFYNFHLIFFSNQLWILNPATDNLINLFPEQFFYDTLAEIIKTVLIISALFFMEGIMFSILPILSSSKHHRR